MVLIRRKSSGRDSKLRGNSRIFFGVGLNSNGYGRVYEKILLGKVTKRKEPGGSPRT